MRIFMKKNHSLFLLLSLFSCLLGSCGSSSDSGPQKLQKGEFVYRKQGEFYFSTPKPEKISIPHYPWEQPTTHNLPYITKEYFRCKGCQSNPPRFVQNGKETERLTDCSGIQKHGLPLRNGKEFIYPILINLMNYLQETLGKQVIITAGHRCPEHNTYIDSSKDNAYSKHQIGAEASFYVVGAEDSPLEIINRLMEYYKINPEYKGAKEYTEFLRYDKSTDVTTQPWYNKEIFIKLYKPNEGRNLEIKHPYPFISIQVRYDRDLNEKVTYSWDLATRNYHRR